jgi:hypothetical protein
MIIIITEYTRQSLPAFWYTEKENLPESQRRLDTEFIFESGKGCRCSGSLLLRSECGSRGNKERKGGNSFHLDRVVKWVV